MQAPDTIEFGVFLDHAQAAFAGVGVVEEDPDVDPLVAEEIGHVAQDAVNEGASARRTARRSEPRFQGCDWLWPGIVPFLLSAAKHP